MRLTLKTIVKGHSESATQAPRKESGVGAGRATTVSSGDLRSCIARSEYMRSDSLTTVQLNELVDRLYGIYSETTRGCTREEFADVVFSAGDVRFVLYYSNHGDIVGFTYAAFHYVNCEGRTCAVFNGGVFFLPNYSGGQTALLFAFRQALLFKLRRPRAQMAYMTRTSSPAAYCLLASMVPRVYPSRRHRTPADVQALALAAAQQRNYIPVGNDPWILRSEAIPRDTSRIRKSIKTPDAQFYGTLATGYAEGESLLTWVPLDVANIAGAVFRLLRAKLVR